MKQCEELSTTTTITEKKGERENEMTKNKSEFKIVNEKMRQERVIWVEPFQGC